MPKDIYIPLFEAYLVLSLTNSGKLRGAIAHLEQVRESWISHRKLGNADFDIPYEATRLYLEHLCNQHQSHIRTKSFEFLTDTVHWLHDNNIQFIIHSCHEYEIITLNELQLDELNDFISSKYGSPFKFIVLS